MDWRRGLEQLGTRLRQVGGLRLYLVCLGLTFLTACQLPFLSTPSPVPHGRDAEIELISGKAWAKPVGAGGWTEFHERLSLLFGDQIRVPREETSPAELRLPDETTMRLEPGTILRLIQPIPPESRPVFRLVQGRMSVDAASSNQLFDIYISATESFTYKFLEFVVDSQQAGTAFELWLDGTTAHIAMATEGQAKVNTAQDETVLGPEWKAWAELDGKIHTVQPRPPDTPTPTKTPLPTHSPTPTVTPTPAVRRLTLTVTLTSTTTLTPTHTPTRATTGVGPTPATTFTPTPKPTTALPLVYQAPTLLEPHSNSLFGFDRHQNITLVWTPASLALNHWYEVQLWQKDEQPRGYYWTKENWWDMGSKYYPGDYSWRVIIVQGKEDSVVGAVSPPSETWYFEWVAVGPADTPTPRPTNTPRPLPTNTPLPTATNTPGPTPIPTPQPRTPTP